jgi:hypothetical protein
MIFVKNQSGGFAVDKRNILIWEYVNVIRLCDIIYISRPILVPCADAKLNNFVFLCDVFAFVVSRIWIVEEIVT